MNHASLFSGIGGFELAASWMGWNNVLSCEIEPFCQRVLSSHFPSPHIYGDIRQLDGTKHRNIDILTGGFPCQPFSVAGKRRGADDNRFLWPEMFRVIREIKPRWIVAENVPGILTIEQGMVLGSVRSDLANEGYEVAPPLQIPACGIGATHRRDRIWFVAHTKGGELGVLRDEGEEKGPRGSDQLLGDLLGFPWGRILTENCWGNDGISERLDSISFRSWRARSLATYGNAIVPQVALQIFRAIQAAEDAA